MRTSEYPYYCPPFPDFNIAQAAVVPFLDEDVNLVVSFATAVGKTVLAECCFAYHLSEEPHCRVVYVCPYRSLGAEKFKAWNEDPQLSNHGVVLGTGDTITGAEDHMAGRLTITTSESFDAKTRSVSYADWLQSLRCVVFDEAHLMGDKQRGSAVEASMIRLTAVNPGARLVLLSATMGNAMELAKWVKSLNGKKTKCVVSSWRPSKIETIFVPFEDGTKVDEAVRLATESSDRKTVVFVHSKVTGAEIVKKLRNAKVRSVFHNASVPPAKRRKIEETFNDRMSGLNVLVSTSTLGAGVNIGV